MNALICPSPYSLTRVASGQAGPEESGYVREHASACAACRDELDALRAMGPAAAYRRVLGAAGPMPDALWKAVSEALRLPPIHLRCRIEETRETADRAPAEDAWLELTSGEAELVPLTMGATRSVPAGGGAVAARLRAGAFEALIRRGPGRLTVVLTRDGEPAPARPLRLIASESAPVASNFVGSAVTDSDGIAVFPRLAAGNYLLELEGLNS